MHVPNGVGTRDLPDEAHKAVCRFSVAESGLYRIKGVVKAPAPSYANNSFFVKLDGGPPEGYLWDTPESTRWTSVDVIDRNSKPMEAGGFMTPDIIVRRYDPDGNLLWTRQFGSVGKNDDYPYAIAADEYGLTVVGFTDGAMPGCTNSGDRDAFVRRYAFNGTELWTRQFGTAADDVARGVATMGSDIWVVGYASAALPGQTHFGSSDAYARVFDLDGNELFTVQFGTEAAEAGWGEA